MAREEREPPLIAENRPYITGTVGLELHIALPGGESLAFIRDCTCLSCKEKQARVEADLPRMLEVLWEEGRFEREATRLKAVAAEKNAEDTARELLLRILPEEQADCLRTENCFVFCSQKGRAYRIGIGYSGNVYSYDRKKYFCCYLNQAVPVHDHMLGQYLALMYNEDLFIETAY